MPRITTAYGLGRIIGVLALSLALAACSAIKLGYNNLQDLSYWWLDSYVDFTDAQTPRLREDLARLHQWHRSTELPRYVELLQRVERLAPGDVTAAQACALIDEGRNRLMALAQQAEPVLLSTALTLSPAQLDYLSKELARKDEDWRKQWLQGTSAERMSRRMKALVERFEMGYGRLEEPQRQVLGQYLAQSVLEPRRMLAERERRQADLLQTLRLLQAPDLPLEEARRLWRGYVARVQASPDESWQRHADALRKENCALVAAVQASATPAQRQAAAERLRGYQRDLSELAAQR
jgi:hypothetical protein